MFVSWIVGRFVRWQFSILRCSLTIKIANEERCLRLILISVFFLASCIELNPPPPAPAFPTPKSEKILRIGIEPNLATLRPILAQQIDTIDEGTQPTLFVTNARETLQRQLAQGELDGIVVYQKPDESTWWNTPIALDSIAVIANPSLELQSLSRSDLQQIFGGDVQNWRAFSGQDRPISLFVDGTESQIQALLNERVMENRPFAVSAVVAFQPELMLASVSESEGGIGFLPTSLLDPADRSVQIVPVDGLFPQFNTVRSQQYPLTIPVYFASKEEPVGQMRQLAAWLQSAEGQQQLSSSFVQLGSQ